jgi:hypothetical protein
MWKRITTWSDVPVGSLIRETSGKLEPRSPWLYYLVLKVENKLGTNIAIVWRLGAYNMTSRLWPSDAKYFSYLRKE